VNKYNRLTGESIENVLIVEDDSFEFRALKDAFKNEFPNLIFAQKDYDTAKTIAKIRPDIIFITLSSSIINEIELLQTIKENVLLRRIPVVLSVPPDFPAEGYKKLNENLVKTAFYSKNFPIDVLKVIRDRLHLEEGLPQEDTSEIWIESKSDAHSEVSNNKPGVTGKRQQVLIVDDDADTLFTVGEMIKRTGSDVSYAKNGLECLSSLKTLKPDLILLDIMMPLMDGFETIKRIKNDKTWKFIPVFAMTAKAMLEDRDVVIKNGFDDLIPKPVNVNELTTKVEKIFSRQTFIEVR
jgi:CheY-like chemotaxis protein